MTPHIINVEGDRSNVSVCESYGYTMSGPRGGSSHKTFRKPGKSPITIPQHEPIKKAYVELVKDLIESEENNEEE